MRSRKIAAAAAVVMTAVTVSATSLGPARAAAGPAAATIAVRAGQTEAVLGRASLGETVPTLLENGSEAVDWWALHTGLQDGADVGDLGLLSSGRQDCLSRTVCAPPVNTPFPAYYGMQLTSALTIPGSRLVRVAAGDAAVNAHAAVRPDDSVVILAVNTDPSKAKSVRLLITGYRAAPAIAVRSYGLASHGIGRSRASARGAVTLPPSSLTELVLRPAGTR